MAASGRRFLVAVFFLWFHGPSFAFIHFFNNIFLPSLLAKVRSELTCTDLNTDELSHCPRSTAQLCWPNSFFYHPTFLLPACPACARCCCLVGVAMELLPRKRLHTQHLMFSSQRAASQRGSDAKHTLYESSCVDWRSGLCSFNTHGFTCHCERSAEGHSHAVPQVVTFLSVITQLPLT